jgi:hypothetical protein
LSADVGARLALRYEPLEATRSWVLGTDARG